MENLKSTNKKSLHGKILKKLPKDPTCLVTWVMKSGKKYFVVYDKLKKIHSVYIPVDDGYKLMLTTNNYYEIEKKIERIEIL